MRWAARLPEDNHGVVRSRLLLWPRKFDRTWYWLERLPYRQDSFCCWSWQTPDGVWHSYADYGW